MTVYHRDDLVTLHHGDCLDVLRALPDNSVDAVVTDPPYGLSNTDPAHVADTVVRWVNGERDYLPPAKGGFMGKAWDSFVPPVAVWDECMRVLKPGGHMLVFAGSRTVDLMTLSIRLAGFDIRDSIAWLYGCLTADAEILTEHGWVNGLDVQVGDRVAQWDAATGAITLAPVQEKFRAPYDGPMRVLRNADTDQVLTPNHRVYHRTFDRSQTGGVRSGTWSDWKVTEAAALNTWQTTRLPVAGLHDAPTGIGGEDYAALLGWVWTEGGFDPSGTGVRIYQSSVNQANVDEIAALMDRLGAHKRYDRERTYRGRAYTETTWFFTGQLAQRVRADLPGKEPTYPLLWRMTLTEKRALLRAAMLGDGHGWGGSNAAFYQKHRHTLEWFQTLLHMTGAAGKVAMRPDRDNGQVSLRSRDTTELQARHLRDSSEDYTGEVWCVRVPTGAFVARRNGHVFITGNSGFPKSLDVSKAIDKAAGAERTEGAREWSGGQRRAGVMGDNLGTQTLTKYDTPATPDAERWQGWGTALKPAHEPIVVARKPLSGTVAANVLEHGTGALNIDGCRVAGIVPQVPQGLSRDPSSYEVARQPRLSQPHASGRWPANALLDESQAEALDEQSGERPTGWGAFAGQGEIEQLVGANSGGASRFFPTFRYQAKAPQSERPKVDGTAHPTVKPLTLMSWLVRLVTPPGGTVLEPFAGSGTTVEACLIEGVRCIAIEREADYLPLIMQRIDRSSPGERRAGTTGEAA